MRKTLIIVALLAILPLMFAEEKTLFDNDDFQLGGFIGPEIRYSQVDGQNGVFVGGRGALTLNKTIAIGGSGFGLVNRIDSRDGSPDDLPYMGMGYGGLDLEGIIFTDEIVHFTIGSMFGAGALVFHDGWEDDWHDDYYYERDTEVDQIWVIEPRAYAEFNLLRFMRLNIGGGYRIVSGIDTDAYENSDVSGPFFGVFLKFGENFKNLTSPTTRKTKI